MRVRITSKLETSDHDGYCSEGECEYKVKTKSHVVDLPIEYKNYPEGKLVNFDEFGINWEDFLPTPELSDGSCYCDLSTESVANGLNRHEYRYTILSIEIIKCKFKIYK